MAQLCFGVIFFSPRRHSCVFFSRLFAELLRELLARLDDEPRERALLLARARGVTPRYPPVLMFHVFLSWEYRTGRRGQREVITRCEEVLDWRWAKSG